MDKKEFIESGILESYVMGQASPQEIMEVEKMISLFPEVKEEIAVIGKSLETYLSINQLTPKTGTREKIFAAIEKEENANLVSTKTISVKRNSPTNTFSWLSIAAGVLLFVSIGFNLYLVSRLQTTRDDLSSLRQQKDAFATELKTQQASFTQLNDDMHLMMMPSTKKVMMHSVTDKNPNDLAIVYWNSDTRDVMLNVQALPSAPADMQYQLWAIVDGKPVDAGVFDMSPASPMIKMKAVSGAVAFAITLEKHGGSPVPTMAQMYVMGKV